MRMGKAAFYVVFGSALMLSVSAFGQKPPKTTGGSQPASPSPSSSPSTPGGNAAGGHREPCWEQAGVSQQVIAQRRSLEQSAKSQVEAVCADSSLNAQQRQEKIRAIHQQTQQQVQGLITPQQQEALKACQTARKGTSTPPPHPGAAKGPCGEALPPPPSKTAPSNQ